MVNSSLNPEIRKIRSLSEEDLFNFAKIFVKPINFAQIDTVVTTSITISVILIVRNVYITRLHCTLYTLGYNYVLLLYLSGPC